MMHEAITWAAVSLGKVVDIDKTFQGRLTPLYPRCCGISVFSKISAHPERLDGATGRTWPRKGFKSKRCCYQTELPYGGSLPSYLTQTPGSVRDTNVPV